METLPRLAKRSPAGCQDPAGLSEKSRKGFRHDHLSRILRDWSTEILPRPLLPFILSPLPVRTPARFLLPARSYRRGKSG
jgi:hypothetical protein